MNVALHITSNIMSDSQRYIDQINIFTPSITAILESHKLNSNSNSFNPKIIAVVKSHKSNSNLGIQTSLTNSKTLIESLHCNNSLDSSMSDQLDQQLQSNDPSSFLICPSLTTGHCVAKIIFKVDNKYVVFLINQGRFNTRNNNKSTFQIHGRGNFWSCFNNLSL